MHSEVQNGLMKLFVHKKSMWGMTKELSLKISFYDICHYYFETCLCGHLDKTATSTHFYLGHCFTAYSQSVITKEISKGGKFKISF